MAGLLNQPTSVLGPCQFISQLIPNEVNFIFISHVKSFNDFPLPFSKKQTNEQTKTSKKNKKVILFEYVISVESKNKINITVK